MKILAVDDSEDKCQKIADLCQGIGEIELEISNSYIDAKEKMKLNKYDLLILDLNLPLRNGEEPKKSLGGTLLHDIERGSTLNRPDFIIGLTEDVSSARECSQDFSADHWCIITYARESVHWRNELTHLIMSRKSRIMKVLNPELGHGSAFPNPFAIIREAIVYIPSLKYAYGLLGLASAVSIVCLLFADLRYAVWGIVILFIITVMLVVFTKIATASNDFFKWPAIIFLWSCVLITIFSAVLLFTSVFFKNPLDLHTWVTNDKEH